MSVPSKTPALRLRLTAAAESIVRAGHPWVFATSVRRQNRPGKMGELAVIYDRHDEFLAAGLFDPGSPIRVRILHQGKPQPLNRAWWQRHLEQARARRDGLFDGQTTGYRCINGENDGWPGLVLDRYDTTLALKIYTAAWLPRLGEVAELLAAGENRIVLRLSRNIAPTAQTQFGRADGQMLHGAAPDGPVVFQESGLRFEADVLHGQKTGFFLDQRENRRHVESLAAGRRVLNLFSYSGGFSLYAARGGAAGVCSVDISPLALAAAERNFALIVLDPPALAKRPSEREEAMRAYSRLLAGAMERLNANGMLVAASCSAHVSAGDFFDLAREAARATGRGFEEWLATRHAPDHPVTFPEGGYLKCIYLRFR
jgi:23S rRNA (cytosine1962-C5)-methyltransferase